MNSAGEHEQDYYSLLGVERDAPLQVIREHYRRLMQQAGNHPDLGGDDRTAALINGAYAVLKDPEKRQFYDARLNLLSRIAAGFEVDAEPVVPDPRSTCLFCGQPHDYILDDLDDIGCESCGSPLRPVDTTRINKRDTRAVQRLARKHDILLYTQWVEPKGHPAITEDISPHGLKMTSRLEVRPGQRIRIVGENMDAVGRVTHTTQQNQGWRNLTIAGVSFLTLRFSRPSGGFLSRRV